MAREQVKPPLALDLDQVLEELGGAVSKGLLRLEIQRGHLKATRFGQRRILVLRSDLDEYMRSHAVKAPATVARRSNRSQTAHL